MRDRGLDFLREKYGGLEFDLQEQRGEDIPRLINTLYEDNEPVTGLTGEDLLDNFLVKEKSRYSNRELVFRKLGLFNKGLYENSVFGLPALCILGKGGISLDKFVEAYPGIRNRELRQLRRTELQEPDFKGKRVVIPKRYEALIKALVRLDGSELMPLDGQVDVTAARDEADYAIDVVLSGATCRREGLGFFPPVLYLSDGVVLANKKAKDCSREKESSVRNLSDFDIWFNTGRVPVRSSGGGNFSH